MEDGGEGSMEHRCPRGASRTPESPLRADSGCRSQHLGGRDAGGEEDARGGEETPPQVCVVIKRDGLIARVTVEWSCILIQCSA